MSLLAVPARGLDLPTGAHLQAGMDVTGLSKVALSGMNDGALETRDVEGQIVRQAWKLPGDSRTSYQVFSNLRDQLLADGYESLFQCQAVSCGGYDFRFTIGHFRAPEMFVDLGDYHYFSAQKDDDVYSLLVSRGPSDVFVELLHVSPHGNDAPAVEANQTITVPTEVGSLGHQLETSGRAVLQGLAFATGSTDLADGDIIALSDLAAYLKANPSRQIALVGHTDAEGSLSGNIAISKRRAASVRTRLVRDYDVPETQLIAEGVGYLAPLHANLTQEGRDANRRVEAVLISNE